MKKGNINWKKWLSIAFGGSIAAIFILAFLAYFVCRTSFFVCNVALPIAGSVLNMEIKADSVKIKGLTKITINNLKVTPNGEETILEAKELMASLNELDLSFGSFSIGEVYLDKGLVNITQLPNGKGNLAAILALMGPSDTNKPPLGLVLDKLTAKDSTIKWKMVGEDNSWMGAELRNVGISGGGLGNKLTGKVTLSSEMDFFMGTNCNATPENLMGGVFTADLSVPLTAELMPGIIAGPMKWNFQKARGTFGLLKDHYVGVDMALSLEEIQKLAVRYGTADQILALVEADGTLNLSDLSATLNYSIGEIDYHLLNSFSAMTGATFEKTQIGSKGTVQVGNSLDSYTLKAQSQIKDLVMVMDNPAPMISLDSDIDVSVVLSAKTLSIAKLHAKGLLGETEFFSTETAKPMVLGWGATAPAGSDDSSLNTKLNLKLADWRSVLSDTNASGSVEGAFGINVTEKGNKVELLGSLNLDSVNMMGYQATGELKTDGKLVRSEDSNHLVGTLGVGKFTAGNASMGVTNFVFNSDYDVSISSAGCIDLTSMNLAFAPTSKAQNKVGVVAKIDLSEKPQPSFLNVTSDGLDVGPVLNWVIAMGTADGAAEETTAASEAAPSSKTTSSELGSIELPIKDFTGKIAINAIYANDLLVKDVNPVLTLKDEVATFSSGKLGVSAGQSSASVEANAKFNLKNLDANLDYDISGINEEMLNELLAASGVKLEKALITAKGNATVAEGFSVFALKAQTSLKDLKLAGETTIPVVSFDSDIDVGMNLKTRILLANKVDAKGLIGEKEFLLATLTKPLSINFNGDQTNAGDSALRASLNLDIPDWRGLIQTPDASGKIAGRFDLSVADSGKQLTLDSKLELSSVVAMGYSAVGTLTLKGGLQRAGTTNSFVGTAGVSGLTVQSDTLDIKDFSASTDYQVTISDRSLEIAKLNLSWTPTDRAKNEISISGNVAYANLAEPSRLKVVSESMDFTPQMSWIKSSGTAAGTDGTVEVDKGTEDVTTTRTVSSDDHSLPLPKTEPAAIDLPVKDFECDINLGVAYLKNIYVSNMVANITLKTNVINVTAPAVNVNGGDTKLSLFADLNQPGYNYSLKYDAPGIPAGPIFDFIAADLPGELSNGSLFAVGSLSGSGITERAIQENFAIQGVCGLTNVSFTVVNKSYRLALAPILTALRVSDLANAPILGVYADLQGTNATFNINSARVITGSFEAEVTGKMNLEPVLMDTPLNLPITIYLEPGVADKSNLASIEVNTNSIGFLAMPNFVKITGTPAEYSINTDKLVITGLLMKSGVGLVGDVGSSANKIVGGVGSVLIGDTKNTNGVQGLVQGVGGLIGIKKKDGDTNNVEGTTNTNSTPSVGGILNIFKKKDK